MAERAARLGGPVYYDDAALLVRDPGTAPDVISAGQWSYFDGSGRPSDQSQP